MPGDTVLPRVGRFARFLLECKDFLTGDRQIRFADVVPRYARSHDYESGGWEFDSLRARHIFNDLGIPRIDVFPYG